jgi:hypothetical protein
MAILLNPRLWLALAIAAALAFGGVFCYRAGKANVRVELDNYKLEQAVKTQKAELAARAEETRRESEKQKVIDEARTKTVAAQSAASDAAIAAVGLRQRVAALVAASRSTSHSSAASGSAGKPDQNALDVLSDVLARSDAVSGDLAAYADSLRISGAACERFSDQLRAAAGR